MENKMSAIEQLKRRIKSEGFVDLKFCVTSPENKTSVSVESTAEEILMILDADKCGETREYVDY